MRSKKITIVILLIIICALPYIITKGLQVFTPNSQNEEMYIPITDLEYLKSNYTDNTSNYYISLLEEISPLEELNTREYLDLQITTVKCRDDKKREVSSFVKDDIFFISQIREVI